MRLASTAHTTQPWLIHEIAPDFRLEDVWALPTPGGPDGFATLQSILRESDVQRDAPPAARLLWQLRLKLGSLLGLDRRKDGLDSRVPSLCERLSPELREAARTRADAHGGPLPFTFLYERDNEQAAEIANRTVHGVMHLSWVPDGEGGWRGQLAILVKPNGWFGAAYMAAIKPFRYLIVYPAMFRSWERQWERRSVR
jgi:hypothetical protein